MRQTRPAGVVTVLFVLLLLGGCGNERQSSQQREVGAPGAYCGLDKTAKVTSGQGYADASDFEGRRLASARRLAAERGLIVRVLGQDGKCFDSSLDGNGERVNFYVEAGEVVRAAVY